MADINGIPYVEATDLVSAYPGTSLALATELDTQLAAKLDASAYVEPGLVLLNTTSPSAVSSISVNSVFSATHQNYLILATWVNTSATTNQLRLRVAGVDSSASYSMRTATFEGTYSATTETASVRLGDNGTQTLHISVNLSNVQEVAPTGIFANGKSSAAQSLFAGGGVHTASTAFDGFTMFCNSGTFTGTIRTYGYKN